MRRGLLPLPVAFVVLAACKPDAGLTKFNSTPEANITAPADGASVLAGTTLALRGSASDPNHPTSELLARWFVDDTEVCASAAPMEDGTTTCDVTVPDATALAVRLEVLDPEGSADADEISLFVTPNAPPVATIQSPVADGVYYSDQLVTFRGTVSDAEDDAAALTAWWEDGDTRLDAVSSTPNGSGEVIGYATLAEGPHALELHVQDSAGNEAVATVIVDVGPPNSAPACAITAPADAGASEEGARVDFAAMVSDADLPASALTVAWESDKDGPLGTSVPDSGGNVSFRTSALSAEDHRITMTVSDEVGAVCVAGIDWTVATAPTIELASPVSGDIVDEGDVVAFTAIVGDAEDPPGDLWVAWTSDVDGILYEGPPDSAGLAEFLDDGLTRGDHVVTATVTDTAGLYATARATLTVNGAPGAPTVTLSPTSPDTDDDLRVSIASVSVDPDGDPVSYSYAWSRDGVASSASASATLPASATTRGDTWRVSVAATDGRATGPAGTASVTIANIAPSLAGVTLSPDPAYEDDVLVCAAGATSDADGDTVGVVYDWVVNGASLGYDSATLDGASFDRGDTVACSATPTDGADDGVTRTSTAVTIANTSPSVAAVSISPGAASVADTLTCGYVGYDDVDGDADRSTYRWTVGGVEVGTGPTLAGAFVGGDVVTCTVTPDDGTDTGSDVSASITVDNTAPALGPVSIAPASAYNDDTLTCIASATDADGGAPTLSYAWTNTSTGVSLGSGATVALSPSLASSDDVVTCTVRANDSGGATASGSAALTLGNRAPVANASLSPSAPTARSTLTCSGSAADADADGMTLNFAWTVDGASVTASTTTATLSTLVGAFAAGQIVACTVTATDGKGGADSDTASASIDNTAPVVSGVTLTPSTVYTNDTLTATASGSDPDGDGLSWTYDWYVDSALVQSGPSATLSGASSFDRDEGVYVVATASDGVDTASASSASVTVRNTPPTAPVVAITPDDATYGDDLTCEVVAASTDADGDRVTYTFDWDVDGAAYTDAIDSATSSFVDGADVGAEQVWTCEVTATDGTDEAYASDSVETACAPGSESGCPADSCLDVRDLGASTGDGTYWIDPYGTGAFAVYCDMTTDGGGWTLGFVKNSMDTDTYADFGSAVEDVGHLAVSPTVASSASSAYGGWLDLNTLSYTELRLRAYSGGAQTYESRSILKSDLRIAFGQNGYFLYNDRNGYYWCGGDYNYTDAGVGQVNRPSGAPADCKAHGSLGSGWDFSQTDRVNEGLTLCGYDYSRWMHGVYGSSSWYSYPSVGGAQAIFVR